MDDTAVVWCGPDKPPAKYRELPPFHLNSHPDNANVHLKINNINRPLARDLPPLILDLLEIASYVYAADQMISRGGRTLSGNGKDWRRRFVFHIPVRMIDVWHATEMQQALIDLLNFLSDDYYEFEFRGLTKEVPSEKYFVFDEGRPWFTADEVLLFSGGLDSLAGLCEAVRARTGKILLVSHRPAPQTSTLQKELLKDFIMLTESKDRLLHVPVWVNKSEYLTRDTNQRTRSFLYASLAASLASLHGLNKIHFYENGITSANLPIAPNVIGARASRTTHPKVLKGYSKLLSLVFNQEFQVLNPYFWKTKADIVKIIVDYDLQELIRYTKSCSHTRTSDCICTHCGVCFQCIGRRLATLYHHLQHDDPDEIYETKMPLDEINKSDDKAMVELFVKSGRELAQIDPGTFFGKYGEALRIVSLLDLPSAEAAERLYQLHKRHGEQVCEVLKRLIQSHSELIARGLVPQNSLLSMIANQDIRPSGEKNTGFHFPTPDGITWEEIVIEIVSDDSVRIRAGQELRTYPAFDMGFRDRRKGNLPSQLWDVLILFAEGKGVLSWKIQGNEGVTYKDINRLRTLLREFFGLDSSPISKYDKKEGYKTCFRIFDRRYGSVPS